MDQFVTTWNQLLTIAASILRPLGGLVLGVAIGWLTAATFLDPEREWQLKIAIFLGLLGAFVTMSIHTGAGTVALFALGAGGSAIALGVRSMQPKKK